MFAFFRKAEQFQCSERDEKVREVNAIRLRRKIESETLHLLELKPFIGKTVEFIVIADEEKPAAKSESGPSPEPPGLHCAR